MAYIKNVLDLHPENDLVMTLEHPVELPEDDDHE